MRLKNEMKSHLAEHILPYWMNKTIDLKNGGFVGRIDGNGKLDERSGEGSVLSARIL